MLTWNVPDVICTFDSDADDSFRTRTDVCGLSGSLNILYILSCSASVKWDYFKSTLK